MTKADVVKAFFDWRMQQGYTVKEAARLLGFCQSYVSKVENGAKPPSERFIASALKFMSKGNQKGQHFLLTK